MNVDEILKEVREFQKEVLDSEANAREAMEGDLDAFYGDLWDAVAPGWRTKMENYGRPVLEMGRMNPIVRRVINDVVGMEPEIKTIGRNTPDKGKADNRQGAIRHIMYNSDAQDAISQACLHAAIMGRGHFRIVTDYVSEKSLDQEIKFEPINNPLNVFMDTNRKGQYYTDCSRALIVEPMGKEAFKREYPDADPVNWEGTNYDDWNREDTVMIGEYYKFKRKKRTLVQFEDGSTMYKDEVDKIYKDDVKLMTVAERDVWTKQLCWYKVTGKEVLDYAELPGTMIPICTVIAEEGRDSKGNYIVYGIVRKSKNAAWMYDLASSLEAENLHQNSINPWMGDPRQFEGFERLYAEANSIPRAYLPANTVIEDGIVLPRPERTSPIPISPVLYNAKSAYIDDMMGASGINEERMGIASRSQSGRAILARSQESKATNSHITRSVGKALTYAGRIINELLPIYYDGRRLAKILDIEMKPSTIEINNGEVDLGDPYDDIIVSMGAGYLNGRMESMESMMGLLQANPSLGPIISDLIAENSDWPGSQKIAERIRSTMPPEVLEAGGGADEMAIKLRQMVAQLQQSQQMIQQLQMALQEASQKADDNALKMELEQIKGQQAMMLQEMKNQNEITKEMIRGDVAIQKQEMVSEPKEEAEGYEYKGED